MERNAGASGDFLLGSALLQAAAAYADSGSQVNPASVMVRSGCMRITFLNGMLKCVLLPL